MELRVMRMVSYADNAEDVVLTRTFHDEPPGFFVDVGAGHPVLGSVVKNLSDLLSWQGVHIDPDPRLTEDLRTAYPADIVASVAAGRSVGQQTLHLVDGVGGLTTLDRDIASSHRQTGSCVQPISVEVRPLNQILAEADVPAGFDLLKVDVEGYESSVFAGIDLAHWAPRVILVEANAPNSPRLNDTTWAGQFADAGYRLALYDGLNQYYVAGPERKLFRRIRVPANVFDRYINVHWYNGLRDDARPGIVFEPWAAL